MKQAIKILALVAVPVFGVFLIYAFGMVFEYEYPYSFVLTSVQSAKSVNGVSVSEIIKGDGAKWPPKLHWHTCSYCADACGHVSSLIYVNLSAPGERIPYEFAYNRYTHTLVPITHRTAAHYPALMPTNDPVRIVQDMNSNTGPYASGWGEFQLPEKWFTKATDKTPIRVYH